MKGLALYRLPHAPECHLVVGTVAELDTVAALNGRTGFVVAPFAVSSAEPVSLISPDHEETLPVAAISAAFRPSLAAWLDSVSNKKKPHADDCRMAEPSAATACGHYRDYPFELFHAPLLSGQFQKIVLARVSEVVRQHRLSPFACFRHACDSYPGLYVSLVYTPKSGLWLAATPELLLAGQGERWHTCALAGTMRAQQPVAEWSAKDRREQRLVADYVADCLRQVAGDCVEEGPRTVRAANLLHLRSDFTFTMGDSSRVGDLLQQLHPTPAVCGLPKEATRTFILQHEPAARRYYSGFMGLLQPAGETRLYVSLRCMQIAGKHCRLYAGGGLLADSREESEWEETERKMDTMRKLLDRADQNEEERDHV